MHKMTGGAVISFKKPFKVIIIPVGAILLNILKEYSIIVCPLRYHICANHCSVNAGAVIDELAEIYTIPRIFSENVHKVSCNASIGVLKSLHIIKSMQLSTELCTIS